MPNKILVTDSLFIFPEHEEQLRGAGYEIERLDKPDATEEELTEYIKGKVGYILGGIEKVTDKVINTTDELKAIVFTGADWRQFIPGHAEATKKGIAIASTPGANTYAVAEYTLAMMLAMTRNLHDLGRTGKTKFKTTHSLKELVIGIVGMRNIGARMAELCACLGVKEILYFSRTQKPEVELKTGAKFVAMDELMQRSDIVTLHASKEAGNGFIGKSELAQMKEGALIVNCGFTGAIEKEALYAELKSGRLRAVQDDPMDERFDSLPLSVWFNSNAHTAYNTFEANKTASDMAVKSILNLLETGKDQFKVN